VLTPKGLSHPSRSVSEYSGLEPSDHPCYYCVRCAVHWGVCVYCWIWGLADTCPRHACYVCACGAAQGWGGVVWCWERNVWAPFHFGVRRLTPTTQIGNTTPPARTAGSLRACCDRVSNMQPFTQPVGATVLSMPARLLQWSCRLVGCHRSRRCLRERLGGWVGASNLPNKLNACGA
jgi:hypothetical protein